MSARVPWNVPKHTDRMNSKSDTQLYTAVYWAPYLGKSSGGEAGGHDSSLALWQKPAFHLMPSGASARIGTNIPFRVVQWKLRCAAQVVKVDRG